MFLYTVWEGHGDFTSAQDFFVSDSQSNIPMSPEPFASRANALPAKRSEKGYGDENGSPHPPRSQAQGLSSPSPQFVRSLSYVQRRQKKKFTLRKCNCLHTAKFISSLIRSSCLSYIHYGAISAKKSLQSCS